MNGNVEVINEHCWAVKMEYVKSGYIGEMKLMKGKKSEAINLTDKGVIVINADSKLCPALKILFPKVMQKPTEELQSLIDNIKNPELLDALDDLYVNVAGWEIKRRCALADYLTSQPQPTFKDKIKNFFRKKVRKWE